MLTACLPSDSETLKVGVILRGNLTVDVKDIVCIGRRVGESLILDHDRLVILNRLFDLGQLGGIQLVNLFGFSLTTNRLFGFILGLYITLMVSGLTRDLLALIVFPRLDIDRGTPPVRSH